MPALFFINKFEESAMTDPEIVSITAIYEDNSEITVCFGFECSSAREGVRAEQNELRVNAGRVDLNLVTRAQYLSDCRTATGIELLKAYFTIVFQAEHPRL